MDTESIAEVEPTYRQLADTIAAESVATRMQRLRDIEGRRRVDAAVEALVLGDLDRSKAYAADGHASMHGVLRSALGWSEGECRQRMQIARLVAAQPCVGETLYDGEAPVANIAAIARAHANPRCGDQLESALGVMLTEACRMEHDDFRRIPQRWELLADRDGAHRDREHSHDNRNAHVVTWQGVTTIAGQWGDVDGATIQEIFDRQVDVEFRADWDDTVARHGDKASKALMPRTEAQRRADALTALLARAVSTPPGSKPPEPVVNILVDHHTWSDLMTVAELFPEHHRDPFESGGPLVSQMRCETDTGELIDPYGVLRASLEGHVRFVILDDTGVPIHWGRKRRLFRGAARDAVRVLGYRCFHSGCRVPSKRTQVDHTVEWHSGGETQPDNGGSGCGRHNRDKHIHRYTVFRDRHGHWHTYRPDGTEI